MSHTEKVLPQFLLSQELFHFGSSVHLNRNSWLPVKDSIKVLLCEEYWLMVDYQCDIFTFSFVFLCLFLLWSSITAC